MQGNRCVRYLCMYQQWNPSLIIKVERSGNSSRNEYNVANDNEYKNKQKGNWYIFRK